MNLFRLMTLTGYGPLMRIGLGAALAALSSAVLLAIVNAAAAEIAASQWKNVNLWLAALFALGVLVYGAAETYMVARTGADVENAIDRVRCGLLDRLRAADLWKLEHFGQAGLYDSIVHSSQVVSQYSQFVALSLRSALLGAAVMIYIATISMLAFLLIGGMLTAGGVAYARLGRTLQQRQTETMTREAGLFEGISDLFDGFKEQKLDSAHSEDLSRIFTHVSAAATDARCEVHLHGWQQFIFGESAFNTLLGVVVFLVPAWSSAFGEQIVKVTAGVLFLATPVFGLMQSLAVMREAESAAGRMLTLDRDLDRLAEPAPAGPLCPVPTDFHTLRLVGATFSFPAPAGETPFTVGPLDLTLRRGETLFITGGNGSGKSTLMKLLTGLYHPMQGTIEVDGVTIDAARRTTYRELIAPVFADFHLFARLHGLPRRDSGEDTELLQWMEMERVTTLTHDRFSRRDLSAGQRKRLALIAAILERRPILMLDEWAADQDPHFRRKFYREILPELKRRGLTIIAVTHDDHYFDAADRRLHMDEGRFRDLKREDGPCA